MTAQPYDPYASHLPALSFILGRLGPSVRSILEVGSGFYSTPLLHAFCAGSKAEHVILESDETWRNSISSLFDGVIQLFDAESLPDEVVQRQWGLAFIDGPVEASRAQHAIRLKDTADVIVLHDSNPNWDVAYGYSAIIPLWKHAHHFTETYPHTLVLTDSDDTWHTLGLQNSLTSGAKHLARDSV